MEYRTDLALEKTEELPADVQGIRTEKHENGPVHTTVIEVTDARGEEAVGKPIGKYITVETPPFSSEAEVQDERLTELTAAFKALLPPTGLVLVAGVGNSSITPDALGPRAARLVFSTRHLTRELQKSIGFREELRPVAAVSTGVLGQTGLESAEYIKSITDGIRPSAVVTIDALASRRLSRLGCTVQLSDTGIRPGSGVGNRRAKVDAAFLGVPVISVGIPTVVEAVTLAGDLLNVEDEEQIRAALEKEGADMVVTPKDIDIIVENAAYLLALALNCALQPSLSAEELIGIMS